ncbi:MAG: aminopeptidase [Anaerolineales bacterium]
MGGDLRQLSHQRSGPRRVQKHVENLKKYRDYLNAQKFTALHYQSRHRLDHRLARETSGQGAQAEFKNGITDIPNLPTEEVFTTPHKGKVDGVASTMPRIMAVC